MRGAGHISTFSFVLKEICIFQKNSDFEKTNFDSSPKISEDLHLVIYPNFRIFFKTFPILLQKLLPFTSHRRTVRISLCTPLFVGIIELTKAQLNLQDYCLLPYTLCPSRRSKYHFLKRAFFNSLTGVEFSKCFLSI